MDSKKIYETLSYPDRKEEVWKYTNLSLLELDADKSFDKGKISLTALSKIPGVVFCDLKTAMVKYPHIINEYSEKFVSPSLNKYAAFNSAYRENGAFLYVPKNTVVGLPFRGTFACALEGNFLPYTIIIVEENSEVIYIDEYISSSNKKVISDATLEIVLKENAKLHYYNLQKYNNNVYHLLNGRAGLKKNASLICTFFGLGAEFSKVLFDVDLNEEFASSSIFGITSADNNQRFESIINQYHNAKYTTSNLLYKNAIKDNARSVFIGLIYIDKSAKKSEAYQSNKNLVLSDTARVNTVPKLEIGNDDVKCSHGVSISDIDKEQIFYLMSRGIKTKEAEEIIIEGFFDELINLIPVDVLKNHVKKAVLSKIYDV